MLPLGGLFSAVRIPGHLLTALSARSGVGCVDTLLAETLGGGPVVCDPRFSRYYALVSAGMPETLRQVSDAWTALDVHCLGRDSHLGVPRLDAVRRDQALASYWSVPMDSATELCTLVAVARLIAAGRQCSDPDPEP